MSGREFGTARAFASLSDHLGLPVSTTSEAAAGHYREGLRSLLSLDAGVEESFAAAARADPGFALPIAGIAVFRWQQGRRDLAEASLARAAALVHAATPRERRTIAIVTAIVTCHGEVDEDGYQAPNGRALQLCRDHLADFPRDGLVLFIANIITIFSGDKAAQEELLVLFEQLEPHFDGDWWFQSWYGFCKQELAMFGPARASVERALSLDRRNPVAAHAFAHVLYEADEGKRNAAFLGEWLRSYGDSAVYHSHISWHYALEELNLGRAASAIEVYRSSIDPAIVTPVRTTLADGAGLLWRGVLAGMDSSGLPWDGLREYAKDAAEQPGAPFRDILAATVFAGAGDEDSLVRLAESERRLGASGHPLAGTVVLHVVEGLKAFVRHDFEESVAHHEPAMGALSRVGGSHQQRELYFDTLVEAYLRQGYRGRAAALLEARSRLWPTARAASSLSCLRGGRGDRSMPSFPGGHR